MNDQERRLWVLNDEGLYRWYRSSRLSIPQFIRENRTELDAFINQALRRGQGKVMPRMTDEWYVEQAKEWARRSSFALGNPWDEPDVIPDIQICGTGPDAREQTGCYVNVWIPDPPTERDPLEERKRAIE